jgi:hypothetical protein
MFVTTALFSSLRADTDMTVAEAKAYLLKVCSEGWRFEYNKAKEAARTLDLGDIVVLLEEIKVAHGDQSDVGPPANPYPSGVLLLLFSRLIERQWDQVAYRYLTIVPPPYLAEYGDSLEGYMAKGKFGGLGNLFTLYYHAETPFAKAHLFQCIQEAFRDFDVPESAPDQYVEYVERWYWKNLKWIRANDHYPLNHAFQPPSNYWTPKGFVNIGLFFVPKRIVEKTEHGVKAIDKPRP